MKRRKYVKYAKGVALITSMIFLIVFSALAVAMASLSGSNLQIAENQRKGDHARACAESGLEVMHYWLDQVAVPGDTPQSQVFSQFASSFQTETYDISNLVPAYDGESTMSVPNITLDSARAKSFSAVVSPVGTETVQADITGTYAGLTKTLRVNYKIATRAHTVFDFGVATKGPLSLQGNILLEGVNISVESSVYIESYDSALALEIIGNSQIGGDVSIANSSASVSLQGGMAGIGGETGSDAIENHVSYGVAPVEFPSPNPGYFEHYATNIVDSSTDMSEDATYENIRIAAGTNPNFTGNVTLKGVVFIETPNVVTFAGNAEITGIIIGDGELEDNSGTNRIEFQGTVDSNPVSVLPAEEQFTGLHDETGTFLMAPGFHVSFGGNFSTLSGAIAGNGIEFFGNAGGTINGSVLNYSDEEMTLSGNSDLFFNRSGTTEVPAGFVPEIILEYDPNSYAEIAI